MHTKTKIKFFMAILLLLIIIIPFNFNPSHSKYVIEDIFKIANIQIEENYEPDYSSSIFELVNISNTNTINEKFASHIHSLTFQIKVKTDSFKITNFNQNSIKVKVGNEYVTPDFCNFYPNFMSNEEPLYEICLYGIPGNGPLELEIAKNSVKDISDLPNPLTIIQTGITIDNIAPTLSFKETLQNDSTSLITINSSECISNLDGWDISSDQTALSKVFYNKVSYPITVYDYAQNHSSVFISVTQANNISILYSTYDNYSSYSDSSNGDVCGKNTILYSGSSKTEMLLVRLESSANLNLQGKVFLYTYWKQNSTGVCTSSQFPYKYGYVPSIDNWYNINSDNVRRYTNKKHTQFGGSGMNRAYVTDSTNSNPIPPEIANQNLYGISSTAFRLTDSSQFSVVYQNYIEGLGWQKACSDGEESILSYDKPISAFRMNIVPKSEKQRLLDYWDFFIGSSRID